MISVLNVLFFAFKAKNKHNNYFLIFYNKNCEVNLWFNKLFCTRSFKVVKRESKEINEHLLLSISLST